MLSCWWLTKRKQNSAICVLLLFSPPKGMFLEQKCSEEKLTPGGRKNCKRQPQCLYMNSRSLTRTKYFPEGGEICTLVTHEALSKGQTSGGKHLLPFLKRWGNSILHTTSHCIYWESQKQNRLLMRWMVGTLKGQWLLGVTVGGQKTFPSLPFCPQGGFQYKHFKWIIPTLIHFRQECVFWNKHH